MKLIEIVDWDKHYENNRTRELKRMAWVPMPNRHDGDGYTSLLDHPNGAAHFGAWCALVEVASRCDVRGTLLRGGAEGPKNSPKPHDATSLSRMTRIPVKVWEEVIPRLVTVGWIRLSEIPQEGAATPQKGATPAHPSANERNGKKEGKKEGEEGPHEGAAAPHPHAVPSPSSPTTLQEVTPMIPEILEIHKRATGVELHISEKEMSQLLALFRKYDGPSVVAAYRICQKEKPGKPFGFFLDDFAMYFAKITKTSASVDPGPACPECGFHNGLHRGTVHNPGGVDVPGCSLARPLFEEDTFPDDIPGDADKADATKRKS